MVFHKGKENFDVIEDLENTSDEDYTEVDRILDFQEQGAVWEPVEFLHCEKLIEEYEMKAKAKVTDVKSTKGAKAAAEARIKEKKGSFKKPKSPEVEVAEDLNGNKPKKSVKGKKAKGEKSVIVNVGDQEAKDEVMKDSAPKEESQRKEKAKPKSNGIMEDSGALGGVAMNPEDKKDSGAGGGVAKNPKDSGTGGRVAINPKNMKDSGAKGGVAKNPKTETQTVTETVTKKIVTKKKVEVSAGPSGDKKPRTCGICREPGHNRTKCPQTAQAPELYFCF